MDWPKDILIWEDSRGSCMSVPFTWLLPKAQRYINAFPGAWLVGGPAVYLMPDYLQRVTIGRTYPGVLQRINSKATRTTIGCCRACSFCGVKQIEPQWRELDDWPDLPILCDNNLLASSEFHLSRVFDRAEKHVGVDFNQGIDARLVTSWVAERLARLKRPIIRMALDADYLRQTWENAFNRLRHAGVAKSTIRSYVLCGYLTSPDEDWDRCKFVEAHGVKALPMWWHALSCMHYGEVNESQQEHGWTRQRQRKVMRWFYRHTTHN